MHGHILSENDQKFDKLAGIYDLLVKLVFGSALRKAQLHFLEELPQEGKVLIMGGGSGWILEEISLRRPRLTLTYVEASGAMLSRAKSRAVKNSVTFIHGNELMLPPGNKFDVLITPFFLDLFGPVRLLATVSLLDQALNRKGLWLFTDFHVPSAGLRRIFAKTLIYIMYRFFRLLCKIDARKLPDFDQAFAVGNYSPSATHYYYVGMIRTMCLKKIPV